jgi:hypothetical protein
VDPSNRTHEREEKRIKEERREENLKNLENLGIEGSAPLNLTVGLTPV